MSLMDRIRTFLLLNVTSEPLHPRRTEAFFFPFKKQTILTKNIYVISIKHTWRGLSNTVLIKVIDK